MRPLKNSKRTRISSRNMRMENKSRTKPETESLTVKTVSEVFKEKTERRIRTHLKQGEQTKTRSVREASAASFLGRQQQRRTRR